MPKPLPSPDRLFDRTWRPGHPFRPRISGLRRWIIGILFAVLCIVIGGYWYITDSTRVRWMAESYLSSLLGGRVQVGNAKLSIFEGLRLDKVRLYVDDTNSNESLLFSAQSFLIQYSPAALLTRKIEATRIVAVDPRVHVIEDVDSGQRNYTRLLESRMPTAVPGSPNRPLLLPEIVLRNAQVDYTRFKRGLPVETNSLGIEGRLTPIPESKIYTFAFQSRGKSAEIGAMVSGRIVMSTGQISASLQNFEFGPDVKAMLPPEVRQYWEDHGLSGRLNIPVLNFTPPSKPGGTAGYRVEIELQGVTLAVRPEEWMGADEHRKLREMHNAMNAMRIAGLNERQFVDHLSELVEPAPLNLKQVHGRFVFSDDQTIKIESLNGWLEEIPFRIDGTITGYSPAAPARIRIASSELHDIEIPAAPRYVNSLPPAVREIYDRFTPRGICRFWVDVHRPTAGARPIVTGQIDIVDGQFSFERFPYPMRKTTGKIILSQDPSNGEENMKLDHIRGQGIAGGPNADSFVEVNGVIGPFGPDARVDIVVTGEDISSEPALTAAFPALTRKALTLFDAEGKGEYPKFSGDFRCDIIRLRGRESHWFVDTSIRLADASGSLAAFPYPMNGVTGDLKIHDDHIELVGIHMKKGDATLHLDGKVYWPSSHEKVKSDDGPALKPNLKIAAKNVPIDRDLLNALPPTRRAWLEKLGVSGKFDLDGTIKPGKAGEDLDFDLRIAMRDGSLWPADGVFAISDVEGHLLLHNQRLTLSDIRGKRGEAELSARGEIAWPTEPAQIVLQGEATNLQLDSSLYKILPPRAQAAWDQVQPQGSLDVAMNYSGTASESARSTTQPSEGYEITIKPRTLTATPVAVPYRLDELTGEIVVLPGHVELKHLAAKHGHAKVRFSGTGTTDAEQSWDFTLAAENVPVDDELKKAAPKALAELLHSVEMRGKVSFEFSKLHVSSKEAPSSATTRSAEAPADIDFAVTLKTADASLDVGVPLAEVNGAAQMTGLTSDGKLTALTGRIDVDSLLMAGRPVKKFRADLFKSPQNQQLRIGQMEAQLAGGSMAGQVDYTVGEKSASHYVVNLLLRDADVRELTGETEQDIHGRLSASLALEGAYDQPGSRRGRGDVAVAGQQMYRIPLVLGLLQVTNLSLPITSPFTEASVRYSIDGGLVTFEHIELRSKEMLMQGDGNLNFDSKQVRMKFVTDSTKWPKLPLIGDLLQGARHELLQIHVRGTLQEPKVSARPMNTLTTTVDEVFRGDEKSAPQERK